MIINIQQQANECDGQRFTSRGVTQDVTASVTTTYRFGTSGVQIGMYFKDGSGNLITDRTGYFLQDGRIVVELDHGSLPNPSFVDDTSLLDTELGRASRYS